MTCRSTIPPGEVTALLGPNGAGKSTLVLAVGGVLRPSCRRGHARRRRSHAPPPRADPCRRCRDRPRGAPAPAQPDRRGQPARRDLRARPSARPAAGIAHALELFPELERRWRIASALALGWRAADGGARAGARLAAAVRARRRALARPRPGRRPAARASSRPVAASGVGVLLIEQRGHVALGLAQTAYVLERGRIHHHGTAQRLKDEPSCCSPPTCCATSTRAATRSTRCFRRRGPVPPRDGDGHGADRPRHRRCGRSWVGRSRTSTSSSFSPRRCQNYGHVWGASYWDEEIRVRDAIEKLRAVREAGPPALVDPTAPGLGRCIPRIQRDQRGGRPQYRRCHRRLRVLGAAELPPLPQRRGDRGAVRPRAAGGDRRHGDQGGVPQVRRRGARPRRRHPQDPRRGGHRGAGDGCAGDSAHERRAQGQAHSRSTR